MIKTAIKLADIAGFILFDWFPGRQRDQNPEGNLWLLAALVLLLFGGCFALGVGLGELIIRVAG
jgi:hypothetical protein